MPALAGALAYLRCRRAENFKRYDHTVLIGALDEGHIGSGEPLLYARRAWTGRSSRRRLVSIAAATSDDRTD